jgi:integrase/recombinase XerD
LTIRSRVSGKADYSLPGCGSQRFSIKIDLMHDNPCYHVPVPADLTPRPDVPASITAAVAALPLPADDTAARWNLRTATAAWLASRRSPHTRTAYFADLADWLAWCERTGLDPRDALRGDVDAYAAERLAALSSASTARKLSTVSSWYGYLMTNGVADCNPVAAVDRPAVSRDASPTVGLSAAEVARFVRAARAACGPTARRDAALLAMLAELGLRVGEALGLDLADLRHNRGHRTVRVAGKGGHHRELPIPAPLGRDLDAYLAERAVAAGLTVDQLSGPLFVTATGRRVGQPAVFRLVRRTAAAAGLPAADRLSPHSLRHTAATAALDAGAPLRDVQDMLGHADPRTTRRYDRSRGSLDRSPAYLIAGLFAHDTGEHPA